MSRLLCALLALIASAGVARADPISAAITAFLASATAAAPLAGTTFLASITAGSFVVRAFTQIALGVALSVIGQMLAPKPDRSIGGVKNQEQFGENAPATVILGRYATAGDRVYANSAGDDNRYYTRVVELGDFPATLRRVLVNGEWVTLSATGHPQLGRAVKEYEAKGEQHLWIRFYDGTQTTADPDLVDIYGDDPDRPWKADMIGRGVPYAIIAAKFNPEVHRSFPEVVFELDGMRLYDPRRDSTVGGSGSQRRATPSTWSAFGDPANENPIVQVYNLMLGLRDPVTDDWLWGGHDIDQADLPVASWFAAMNECDATAAGEGGDEPQYRSGVEISLADEAVVADAIEETLKSCQGQIAEAAGTWLVRAGAPTAAVYAFTDDDIVVTSPEEYDPFPGLDQTFNGVTATYPEPEDGWQPKEAPPRNNPTYLAEDGRRQVADLRFPTVSYRAQVQRLMKSALDDSRRFARHAIVLPPEARALGPLDVVEWTSARNGYETKAFTIDLIEDLPSGCVAVSLREVDPDDYSFTSGDVLPTSVGYLGRPPRLPQPTAFSFEAATVRDAGSTGRRPAVRVNWDPSVKANGVRWQYQLLALPADQDPLIGGADYSDDDLEAIGLEVFEGEPLLLFDDTPVISDYFADVLQGTALITAGILPATVYWLRARYVGGPWCAWESVTTPDTRISEIDLDAALNTRIDAAQTEANTAAADAAAALIAANEAKAEVLILAGDTIADLQDLLDALEGVDAGDIIDNRLLALVALETGWNADPTFQLFTSDLPDKWTATGLTGNGGPFAGRWGGGLALDIGSGAIAVSVTASSAVSGQMPAADPEATWVVLYALVTFTSGNSDALTLRAEWLADGAGTWSKGDMLGLTAPNGTFTQLGLSARPGVMQGVEVLVRRPAGLGTGADGVRIALAKTSAITTAVDCDFHLVGLRAASEAEIAAGQAAAELAAAVDTLTTEIEGVADALAAYQVVANAAVGAVAANLAANYLTTASVTAAIAAAQTTLTTAIGAVSTNLSTNYYTRSQVDSGISTAVGVASTTLGGQIDDVAADIIDEAGFRASGDSALAGRLATIEARSDPGSIVTNGSFGTGSFAGWSFPGIHPNFSVVARGGTNSAQQTCPSPFMVRIAADATTARTILNETREAKQGDICSVSALYAAGGTTRDVTLRFIVRYLDVAGAVLASNTSEVPNTTGTAWTRVQSAGTTAPANTAFVRFELQRGQGGSGDAYLTGIEGRKGDGAALARISTVEAVAASANGAITSLSTSINASFGSQSAFISETSAAVASLDALSAAWVFRQKAGAAVGTAEAVAFTAPDGTPLSTFSLDYDYIDLEGRVSARDLVISDSTNLVPDDQLQSAEIWVDSAEWQIVPVNGQANSKSLGELRYIGTSSTGSAISTGKPFAVQAGDKLACYFQVKSQDGTFRCYAQLQFLDRNGAQVSLVSHGVTLSSGTALGQTATAVISVPATAVSAIWRFVVDRTQTTSSMVRFMGPMVRRQSQAVEIADGAITAEKANFSDLGAVVATLGSCTITSSLNFADGVVVTGAVALNAIFDIAAANRTSLLTLSSEDTWYDVNTLAVSVADGATVLVTVRATIDRAATWNTSYSSSFDRGGNITYRVLRGATQIFLGQQNEYIDDDPGPGVHTYKFQAMSLLPDLEEFVLLDASGNPIPYTLTSKIRTARIATGRTIVKQFKR